MTRSRRRKLSRINGLKNHPVARVALPVASTLLASVSWAIAQAQEQEQGVGLQEVVVTAQKRVENLQDVPIAVEVLDNTKLEQLNITNIDGYVKYVPSLSYNRGNGQGGSAAPGQSHIYIRGVVNGGDGNHSGSQPSVGTYLDEQPITTIDGTPEIHLYDIARVEVLKGPQGTLFGASSESGTVRIITNKPDKTKFDGNVTVEGNQVDHGSTGYSAEGFVNIPLADFAAVRLVGWYEHDAGYIDNIQGNSANGCIVNGIRTFPTWSGQVSATPMPCPTPGVVGAGAITDAPWVKSNFNPVDTSGGRAAFQFDIGPNWTVSPTAMGQQVKTEGFFGYDPQAGDLKVNTFGADSTKDSWYQLAMTVEGKMSDFDLVYAGAFMKRTNHTVAEYSDYSLFYDRVYGSGAYWTNNAGQPIMPQEFVIGGGYFEKWNQELRVTTPSSYFIRGTVGGFIQRQLHNIVQQYTMPGYGYTHVTGDPGVPGNPDGFSDSYSLPNLPNTIWLTAEQRVDRDKAIFAQFDWDITPSLMLTGGARQYWYDNSLVGFYGYSSNFSSHTGMATCFEAAYVKNTPCTNLDTSTSNHGIVPKVTLTWKIALDKMVYATFSKGFRPGGVNRIAGPNGVPYQPDYLKNYEVGWKTEWLDRRLRWNGAFFWEDWKDFQFAFLVPPSITAITNAGNARIKGVENELTFQPDNNLTLSVNFTWLHAYLMQNFCQTTGVTDCPNDTAYAPFQPPTYTFTGPFALAGTDLPQVPKFKGNAIVRYQFGDVASWRPFGQASVVYQTETAPNLKQNEQNIVGFMPSWYQLDLSGGATHNDTQVTLYITNVTDKRGQLTRFANITPAHDNQIYIVPTQPRTIGLQISQNF